jgi:hypothetical protein
MQVDLKKNISDLLKEVELLKQKLLFAKQVSIEEDKPVGFNENEINDFMNLIAGVNPLTLPQKGRVIGT